CAIARFGNGNRRAARARRPRALRREGAGQGPRRDRRQRPLASLAAGHSGAAAAVGAGAGARLSVGSAGRSRALKGWNSLTIAALSSHHDADESRNGRAPRAAASRGGRRWLRARLSTSVFGRVAQRPDRRISARPRIQADCGIPRRNFRVRGAAYFILSGAPETQPEALRAYQFANMASGGNT